MSCFTPCAIFIDLQSRLIYQIDSKEALEIHNVAKQHCLLIRVLRLHTSIGFKENMLSVKVLQSSVEDALESSPAACPQVSTHTYELTTETHHFTANVQLGMHFGMNNTNGNIKTFY